MASSIKELEKAQLSLEKALAENLTDISRDASIQRFEFCIELAWKVSRKAMGTQTSAPKQVIREMGQAGLIGDVTLWLEAIDKRNLTAHTYNELTAVEVFSFIKKFNPELRALISALQSL